MVKDFFLMIGRKWQQMPPGGFIGFDSRGRYGCTRFLSSRLFFWLGGGLSACPGIPDAKAKASVGQGERCFVSSTESAPHPRAPGETRIGAKANSEDHTVQTLARVLQLRRRGDGREGCRRVRSFQTDVLLRQRSAQRQESVTEQGKSQGIR